jgi:small conductance mechanosensitive channel
MTTALPGWILATARSRGLALIPETEKLLEMGARIALTLVVAFVGQRLLFLLTDRVARVIRRGGGDSEAVQQRARTVTLVLRNIVTTLVAVGALVHILDVLGWDVKPLLAGAGIVGVALGFGAQTLVRDVIAGIFILAEDQYSVGDLIEVNGRIATVEAITLRITTLRDFNGYVHFVPNGELKMVTNRSRGWQRLAVDVPIAIGGDLDAAIEVCRQVAAGLNADPAWRPRLLDPIEVWGIESLGPAEATLRMVLRTRPGPDGPELSRELRRRAHDALAAAGHRFSTGRELTLAAASPSATRP